MHPIQPTSVAPARIRHAVYDRAGRRKTTSEPSERNVVPNVESDWSVAVVLGAALLLGTGLVILIQLVLALRHVAGWSR